MGVHFHSQFQDPPPRPHECSTRTLGPYYYGTTENDATLRAASTGEWKCKIYTIN